MTRASRPGEAGRLGWVARLGSVPPAGIEWPAVARAAVSMVVPLGVGLAFGQTALGLLASVGTLPVTMGDPGGPLRLRLPRIALGVVGGALGYLVGGAVRGHGWASVVVVTAVGAVSVLISVIGAAASRAGLYLTIFAIVGAGRSIPGPVWLVSAVVAAGGGFALGLTVLGSKRGRRTAQREPVADAYRAIARVLATAGSPGGEEARQALTQALDAAYDSAFALRIRAEGRSPGARRLVTALIEANPLIEAADALIHRNHAVPAAAVEAVDRLADAVLSGNSPPPPEWDDRAGLVDLAEALRSATRALAMRGVGHRVPDGWSPVVVHRRAAEAVARVIAGPATWSTAARLALCLGGAEALVEVAGIERSYWVPMTVAVVIKPDFGSPFARAVQRAVGTAVGVALGAAVVTTVPTGPLLLPFVALFAVLLRALRGWNYAVTSVLLSGLILVLIDSVAHNGQALLTARLIDTLLGCGIVLVLGYALWPGTWRSRLPARLASTVEGVREYLVSALRAPTETAALRHRTYRSLADLRSVLQRAMAEPPPAGSRAAARWPVTIALERVTDAVTAAAVSLRRAGRSAPDRQIDALAGDLTELAAAIRQVRAPLPCSSVPPCDGAMADLRREIGATRSALMDAAERSRRHARPLDPAA